MPPRAAHLTGVSEIIFIKKRETFNSKLIHRPDAALFRGYNLWFGSFHSGGLDCGESPFYLLAFVVDGHQRNDYAGDAQPLCGRQSSRIFFNCRRRQSLSWRASHLFGFSQLLVCEDGIAYFFVLLLARLPPFLSVEFASSDALQILTFVAGTAEVTC